MGAGSADDITVGTLRRLKEMTLLGVPLLLRTGRHPSVAALAAEGVSFSQSFDDIYESSRTFEDVYTAIVEEVLSCSRQFGHAGYLVPGHPLVGESTVQQLLRRQDDIEIEIIAGSSFIEACLAAARQEVTGIVVLDALSLPDPTNAFRKFASLYNPNLPLLIYQVYDREIASRVKLSLLERYSPEHEVLVISAAGLSTSETVVRTPLHHVDHSDIRFDHLTSVLAPPIDGGPSITDFTTLLDIMAQLRNPVTGCPWDREQTPESLKRFAIEEVYEVIEAIDDGDVDKYVEELGDLLLQVAFHAQLGRESGDFTIEDVVEGISEKLIRRHPHVFGDLLVNDSAEVLANWEVIKRAEKGNSNRKSRLDGVPRHLPALAQALEISKRAAKAGFEWESIDGVFDKIDEEIKELKEALGSGDQSAIHGEIGDLLFTVVNIARFAKIDPEDSLRIMVKRFSARFMAMETGAGRPLEDLKTGELEVLWQVAKREESRSGEG
jgi:tetrapyrrole methylase family protein/MazG family protein